jgi:hypothetical protein
MLFLSLLPVPPGQKDRSLAWKIQNHDESASSYYQYENLSDACEILMLSLVFRALQGNQARAWFENYKMPKRTLLRAFSKERLI